MLAQTSYSTPQKSPLMSSKIPSDEMGFVCVISLGQHKMTEQQIF